MGISVRGRGGVIFRLFRSIVHFLYLMSRQRASAEVFKLWLVIGLNVEYGQVVRLHAQSLDLTDYFAIFNN